MAPIGIVSFLIIIIPRTGSLLIIIIPRTRSLWQPIEPIGAKF